MNCFDWVAFKMSHFCPRILLWFTCIYVNHICFPTYMFHKYKLVLWSYRYRNEYNTYLLTLWMENEKTKNDNKTRQAKLLSAKSREPGSPRFCRGASECMNIDSWFPHSLQNIHLSKRAIKIHHVPNIYFLLDQSDSLSAAIEGYRCVCNVYPWCEQRQRAGFREGFSLFWELTIRHYLVGSRQGR